MTHSGEINWLINERHPAPALVELRSALWDGTGETEAQGMAHPRASGSAWCQPGFAHWLPKCRRGSAGRRGDTAGSRTHSRRTTNKILSDFSVPRAKLRAEPEGYLVTAVRVPAQH